MWFIFFFSLARRGGDHSSHIEMKGFIFLAGTGLRYLGHALSAYVHSGLNDDRA